MTGATSTLPRRARRQRSSKTKAHLCCRVVFCLPVQPQLNPSFIVEAGLVGWPRPVCAGLGRTVTGDGGAGGGSLLGELDLDLAVWEIGGDAAVQSGVKVDGGLVEAL
eukprot:scaffold21247_cov62-Isochrysis_galbana.AAC.1